MWKQETVKLKCSLNLQTTEPSLLLLFLCRLIMIVLLILLLSLCFIDECGIVAQISQPLADSDISAYYISTFSFDHALVSPAF